VSKTFLAYWTRLRMKNMGLNDESSKMTITVASFRKSMEQSYNQGAEDAGKKSGFGDGGDLFGDMFNFKGGRR